MNSIKHTAAVFFAFISTMSFLSAGETPAGTGGIASPKIISLYAAHTEVLLRLGARDNIVGVSRQETYAGPETEGWEAPAFSSRDDVEKFLAVQPDIVLARPQHVTGGSHLKEALERAGVKVIALQVTKADELYDYWRRLAGLVGREDEAEAMIRHFSGEVRRRRNATAGMTKKPGVFIEAIYREVKTFTPDSLPIWVIEQAGGINVAADATPTMPGVIIAEYGPERLLSKAAEIDVFLSQDGAMNRASLEEVRGRNFYQPIRAFREGRVYKIPEAVLSRPTPSLLTGLEMIAKIVENSCAAR